MSEFTIKIEDELEETMEVLARSIIHMAEAFEKLEKTPLTMNAIVILVHDACGGKVNKTQVRTVLENVVKLKDFYIKDTLTKPSNYVR